MLHANNVPLGQRNISDEAIFVHLHPLQCLVGGSILYVMTGVVWEHGSITCAEIESARHRVAHEDGDSALAFVEVQPLLRIWMPMKLTQTRESQRLSHKL